MELNDLMKKNIAPKEKIGRISGYGWSFGYLGGLIGLTVCLFVFSLRKTKKHVNGFGPTFGQKKIVRVEAVTNVLAASLRNERF